MYSNNTWAATLYLGSRTSTPSGYEIQVREDGKYIVLDKRTTGYLAYGITPHLTVGARFIPIDSWRTNQWAATGFKSKQKANAYAFEHAKQHKEARWRGSLDQQRRFREGNYDHYR